MILGRLVVLPALDARQGPFPGNFLHQLLDFVGLDPSSLISRRNVQSSRNADQKPRNGVRYFSSGHDKFPLENAGQLIGHL